MGNHFTDAALKAITRSYITFIAGGSTRETEKLIKNIRQEYQASKISIEQDPFEHLQRNGTKVYTERNFDNLFKKVPELKGLKNIAPLINIISSEFDLISSGHKYDKPNEDVIYSKFSFTKEEFNSAMKEFEAAKVDGKNIARTLSEKNKHFSRVINENIADALFIDRHDINTKERYMTLRQAIEIVSEIPASEQRQVSFIFSPTRVKERGAKPEPIVI